MNAVHGWMELGCPAEAEAELRSIEPEHRDHPMVLDTEWQLLGRQGRWDDAHRIAEKTVLLYPKLAVGWIHRAYSARRKTGGSLEEAQRLLKPACERFKKEAIIPYNLACYAAQLGALEEANRWMNKALRRGDRLQLLTMGLADEDLRPLWPRLAKLKEEEDTPF